MTYARSQEMMSHMPYFNKLRLAKAYYTNPVGSVLLLILTRGLNWSGKNGYALGGIGAAPILEIMRQSA